MSADDVPELVFEGEYSEALFLKTLIESAGIEASIAYPHTRTTVVNVGAPSAIYVRGADVEPARELVADFLKNGKRTDPW
jgi:hypothetical protein